MLVLKLYADDMLKDDRCCLIYPSCKLFTDGFLTFSQVRRLSLGDVDASAATADKTNSSDDDDIMRMNQDLREMVMRILADNVRLRKKMNSVSHSALRLKMLSNNNNDSEAFSQDIPQGESLDR